MQYRFRRRFRQPRFVVRLPRSLHRELAKAAEREGVRLNAMVNLAINRGLYREGITAREKEPTHHSR